MQLPKTNIKLAKKSTRLQVSIQFILDDLSTEFVAISVCGRFGLWTFRSVAASVCGLSGLWPFQFVAVSVCGRFGLWPFRFWPFRFVAVMTRNPLKHTFDMGKSSQLGIAFLPYSLTKCSELERWHCWTQIHVIMRKIIHIVHEWFITDQSIARYFMRKELSK